MNAFVTPLILLLGSYAITAWVYRSDFKNLKSRTELMKAYRDKKLKKAERDKGAESYGH